MHWKPISDKANVIELTVCWKDVSNQYAIPLINSGMSRYWEKIRFSGLLAQTELREVWGSKAHVEMFILTLIFGWNMSVSFWFLSCGFTLYHKHDVPCVKKSHFAVNITTRLLWLIQMIIKTIFAHTLQRIHKWWCWSVWNKSNMGWWLLFTVWKQCI